MAGMSLRASVGARAGGSGLYPVPATPSASAPSTAAVAAYGPMGGPQGGARTAALGAGCSGVIAAILMVYIWWSLPR
jgi:hypothetical protein